MDRRSSVRFRAERRRQGFELSGAFRSKLARLRRDELTQGARSIAEAKEDVLPEWLGKTLARRSASRHAAEPCEPGLARAAAAWPRASGAPSDIQESTRSEGEYAYREIRIRRDGACHGEWRLDEVTSIDPGVIANLTRDPALRSLDLEDAVFVDTETTGLSGGAGVYVYMVGLGWFEAEEYVSWQGFLRHPGEELALLAECAERIRSRSALVSFFGKSFDRHRLEDKMRIAGVEPPFEGLPHLDLYHPFRRLTNGAFEDGKLQTMERELLAFHRERDLPGSLAPAAWFDYLAGRPHHLEGVFQHNHEDVLSLVVLAAYLGRAGREARASGAPLRGPAAHRALALAGVAGDGEDVLRLLEAALERGLEGPPRRGCWFAALRSCASCAALPKHVLRTAKRSKSARTTAPHCHCSSVHRCCSSTRSKMTRTHYAWRSVPCSLLARAGRRKRSVDESARASSASRSALAHRDVPVHRCGVGPEQVQCAWVRREIVENERIEPHPVVDHLAAVHVSAEREHAAAAAVVGPVGSVRT